MAGPRTLVPSLVALLGRRPARPCTSPRSSRRAIAIPAATPTPATTMEIRPTSSQMVVRSSRFCHLRSLDALRGLDINAYFLGGSSGNTYLGGRVAEAADSGLFVDGSTDNVFRRLTLSGNVVHGVFVIASSPRNVLSEIFAVANDNTGIKISDSGSVVVSHATVGSNQNSGLFTVGAPSTGTRIAQLLALDNGAGVFSENVADVELAQIVSSGNTVGILSNTVSDIRYRGALLLGDNGDDCPNAAPGSGLDATCAIEGGSTAEVTLGVVADEAPVGQVLSDDPVGDSDDDGAQTRDAITDWARLATPERAWGAERDAAAVDSRGRCVTDCRIWDWSLAQGDTVVLGTSGGQAAGQAPLSVEEPCPMAVHGDEVMSVPDGAPFLINAVEWAGDGDGLCESEETCVLSRNFGAYQGHGDGPTPACAFVDGSVSQVRMRAWPSNGR